MQGLGDLSRHSDIVPTPILRKNAVGARSRRFLQKNLSDWIDSASALTLDVVTYSHRQM